MDQVFEISFDRKKHRKRITITRNTYLESQPQGATVTNVDDHPDSVMVKLTDNSMNLPMSALQHEPLSTALLDTKLRQGSPNASTPFGINTATCSFLIVFIIERIMMQMRRLEITKENREE